MTDHQPPMSAFDTFGTWLRQDPEFEEAKRRLRAMTPEKRVQAMRAGQLSLRLCLHWASRRPQEVPLLDGEWEFIAIRTPDVADAGQARSQRERVTESLVRCPDRDRSDRGKH
jgi:hypothetical protein